MEESHDNLDGNARYSASTENILFYLYTHGASQSLDLLTALLEYLPINLFKTQFPACGWTPKRICWACLCPTSNYLPWLHGTETDYLQLLSGTRPQIT